MEEETRFLFCVKRPFFFYRRNDTPTHEQSSDIIVAKSKGFFHHSTTFHSTFHLFRLITRIYEFLSQENDLAKRIPRLYTAWIPGRRIRLCLFTDTDEGRRMKKNGGAGWKYACKKKLRESSLLEKLGQKIRPRLKGSRRLFVAFPSVSPTILHPPLTLSAFHPLVAQLFSVEAL